MSMKHVYISLEDTFKQNKFFQELRILGLKKKSLCLFQLNEEKVYSQFFWDGI